jgi:hypothetical protein
MANQDYWAQIGLIIKGNSFSTTHCYLGLTLGLTLCTIMQG